MLLRESTEELVARRSGSRRMSDADANQELSLHVAPAAGEQPRHDDDDGVSAVAVDPAAKHKLDKPSSSAKSSGSGGSGAPAKILFLDGVRGVAAVLVVTQHAGYMFGVNLGHCAVDIFFVLSAFLLTWLFYKKSEKLLTQQASLRKWGFALADYFSKRFFRVYPLFAIVAVFLWLLPNESKQRYFLLHKPQDYDLLQVLTFEFKFRYHVFWTLPLEIAYYFLIPVIVLAAIGLGRAWWLPCGPLIYWIWCEGWMQLRGDHQPLSMHLSTFVCGSLAAIFFVKIEAAIKRSAFSFSQWHVLILRSVEFVTFWLLLSVFYRGLWFDWFFEHPHQVDGGARFISFHVTILIIIEMIKPSALSTALEWSVLRHWGKIGFSVYLLHSFVIYNEAIRTQENYYDKLVSQFFLIHVLATVSFHLVEQPCQTISTRISKALAAEQERAGAGAPALFGYTPVALQEDHGGEEHSTVTFKGSLLPVSVRSQ